MKMVADNNPFAQLSEYSEVLFTLRREQVPFIEIGFEDVCFSQSSFEVDEDGDIYRTRLVMATDDAEKVLERLRFLSELHGQIFPEPAISLLQECDWVSIVQASFKPIHAGRFYVYGSHITDAHPADTVPILMNAGAAFGTGEHETTSGCLQAIDRLERSGKRFARPLDMGCGSGILAIAAAKLWQVPTLAVDIDEVSVDVARENMGLNGVAQWVTCAAGDGYRTQAVSGKYDLIIANILAGPLVEMAPDLAAHLADGGMVILSGLLDKQADAVLAAHEAVGLKLADRVENGVWPSLILQG